MSTSRAETSIRRCWRTSHRPHRRFTSTSSGFGPGSIGDEFADALIAKAADGSLRSESSSIARVPILTERSPHLLRTASGSRRRGPGRPRDPAAGARPGRSRPAARTRWNFDRTREHRPSQARRRRRSRRLGRRRGDRGSLLRRSVPRPVPSGRRSRCIATATRLPRDLPLAGRRRPPGGARRSCSRSRK